MITDHRSANVQRSVGPPQRAPPWGYITVHGGEQCKLRMIPRTGKKLCFTSLLNRLLKE